MTAVEKIKKRLKPYFSANLSKNLFSTDYIFLYVQQFILQKLIPMSDMILALRGVEQCGLSEGAPSKAGSVEASAESISIQSEQSEKSRRKSNGYEES